jgi:hypothetical protein
VESKLGELALLFVIPIATLIQHRLVELQAPIRQRKAPDRNPPHPLPHHMEELQCQSKPRSSPSVASIWHSPQGDAETAAAGRSGVGAERRRTAASMGGPPVAARTAVRLLSAKRKAMPCKSWRGGMQFGSSSPDAMGGCPSPRARVAELVASRAGG